MKKLLIESIQNELLELEKDIRDIANLREKWGALASYPEEIQKKKSAVTGEFSSLDGYELIKRSFDLMSRVKVMRKTVIFFNHAMEEQRQRQETMNKIWAHVGVPFSFLSEHAQRDSNERMILKRCIEECEALGAVFDQIVKEYCVALPVMGDPMKAICPSFCSPPMPVRSASHIDRVKLEEAYRDSEEARGTPLNDEETLHDYKELCKREKEKVERLTSKKIELENKMRQPEGGH